MSDPFRANPFIVLQSPVKKPEETYTPTGSPRRNSPSKTAIKYSPAVSFRRDSNNFMNSAVGRNFIQRADESPLRSSTARKLFTEQESPKRNNPALATIVDPFNDSEDEITSNDNKDIINHYSIFNRRSDSNDFKRSVGSERTEIETPKPVFSTSSFAAAGGDANSLQDSLGEIPMLTPRASVKYSIPVQQDSGSRISSAGSEKTAQSSTKSELYKKKSNVSSYFSSDQSTIDVPMDKDFQYPANDQRFTESQNSDFFDKNLMDKAPMIQPRRNRYHNKQTVFRSKTGNLVLDTPVPGLLHDLLPLKDSDEFDYMKYSAVTSDPNDFVEDGFTLRAIELERETEIVICITMYNEDEVALTRTLHGVFQNIAYLTKRKRSSTWGEDSWKKVVICIVADGRNKISPGVLEVLGTMGVYQEGIAKSFVNQKEVKAHLFEYTAQVTVNEDLKIVGDKDSTPVQVVFCMKEKNAKKINSHRWLFNAICPILNPNVCVLLDVGTRPNISAVYELWKAFDLDSNVAGAAGQIVAMKGKYWDKLINPLVATQNFEYKMSNILDKPCESTFGYISVLPGALSAYRFTALKNHPDGTGPLQAYFQGETLDSCDTTNIFSANMYLAEDRILAWELVAKKGAQWVLKYCKDAKGETDVPESLSEFVLQRRRWLNGAFFAALYSLKQSSQMLQTDHSAFRKFFFHVEFIYQGLTLLFSFFSIANFYITFYYLAGSLITLAGTGGKVAFEILNYICICTLLAMLVISMGNKPTGAPKLFWLCVILLTICGAYAFIAGFYFLAIMIKSNGAGDVGGLNFASICVSLASTYGVYALSSFLYLDPWHILSSSLQYFLMLPAYTCLLQIYAFCNTHDVSWGTKGDTEVAKSLGSAIIETDEKGQQFITTGILEQQDIDSMYSEIVLKLKERRKKPIDMRNKESKKSGKKKKEVSKEDYYRDVRSRVVLFWVILNTILVMTITQIWEAKSIRSNKYLSFILWSVFGFSLFRFTGSLIYLCTLGIRKIVVAKHKWDLKKDENIPQMNQLPT
ncbi:Chitin synthase, class 2 [Pichia californica]|uniref:chitin synthase n=1 Tax=Pichia californica TaxID=460514 RepID=A0A9P7BI53_9ASCO|nr:Chitin synthase, class 2 [[Candida] californica]KAG0690994.1 Chitin synthase, class 2 [[Candida] californica]